MTSTAIGSRSFVPGTTPSNRSTGSLLPRVKPPSVYRYVHPISTRIGQRSWVRIHPAYLTVNNRQLMHVLLSYYYYPAADHAVNSTLSSIPAAIATRASFTSKAQPLRRRELARSSEWWMAISPTVVCTCNARYDRRCAMFCCHSIEICNRVGLCGAVVAVPAKSIYPRICFQ